MVSVHAPHLEVGGVVRGLNTLIRGFNKHVLNPAMLHLAGRPHWYAARLEHVGRRSGRSYATPLVAAEVPGGFVIPLPYGPDVDWLRNLRAGGAVLVTGGRRYALSAPEVLRTGEIFDELPRKEQLRARLWRIDHWVRVVGVSAD
jgi:deazaflavin-dependent oxidoreductase (nitroreductase family)